jgi:hypothetical protein
MLVSYGGVDDETAVNVLIRRAWNLENEVSLHGFSLA